MNLLSDYKTISEDTIKKVFEISDAAEESVHYVEEAGMKYGIIKNFYTDPSAVKNFIRENFALIDFPVTNSPGVQLYFNQSFNNSLSHVMEYFHGILMKHYFPASQEKMFKVPIWETYVNFYWKNMKAKLPNIIPHVDEFNYGFAVDWMRKDLKIAIEESEKNNSELPVTKIVDQFYSEVQDMGGGRWDTSSLIKRFRK